MVISPVHASTVGTVMMYGTNFMSHANTIWLIEVNTLYVPWLPPTTEIPQSGLSRLADRLASADGGVDGASSSTTGGSPGHVFSVLPKPSWFPPRFISTIC